MKRFFTDILKRNDLKNRSAALIEALNQIMLELNFSPAENRHHQEDSLKKLLTHAYENTAFYREKYDEAGFHPSQVHTLENLCRIPILTKKELRNADPEKFRAQNISFPVRTLSSSGSTGKPIRILRSESSLWLFCAYNIYLYYHWCDRNPLSNVLYFLDSIPTTIDYAIADLLRTTVSEDRIISTYEPIQVLVEKLFETNPEFISSYPTTMKNIAMFLNRRRQTIEELKILHVTSEMMDVSTRRLLHTVFPNARLIETYTSTEAALVGYPCLTGGGFHLSENSNIVEILDTDGQPTTNSGEIVITDLTNLATPMIRYSGLGDLCRFDDSPCRCGSPHRRICHLEGRYIDAIILPDGTSQSPYVITNALGEVESIYQYQIIQQSVNEFCVKVVRNQTIESEQELETRISAIFKKTLKTHVICRVDAVKEILPENTGHKIPILISEVSRMAVK